MSKLKNIFDQSIVEINATLEELVDIKDDGTLLKAMQYSLFSGGKRLRPILTKMVAEMVKGDTQNALKAGAALELIHTYSLIHDDLPSMDNDDYRRGKLTNHKIFGEAIAILAGDGLLTYAFDILSRLTLAPEKVIKIISLYSKGAGYSGMVGGQVLDLEAENKKINLEQLKTIHSAKTGALFKCAVLAGAYCGEPTNEEIKALEEYADNLGLTFQIVDDILDVIGDEKKLGKKLGSDLKQNKSTYPSLLGLDVAKKEAEKAAQKAKESLQLFGSKAQCLQELVDYLLKRQS